MMKRILLFGIVLSLCLNSFAQEKPNELTPKEKHQQYVKATEGKISGLEETISVKEHELNVAKSNGETEKANELLYSLRSLKAERKKLEKSTSKVITVAMPLVGKNAMMGFFGGVAGTFVYNLDRNRQSPYSITSAYVNKSLENSGILLGITNLQYLANIHYEYEMPLSVVNVGDFDLLGQIDMVLLKAWRKIGNSKWYAGVKAEYNKSSVEYGIEALSSMNGATTMYSPGIVLDYDSRDKKQFATKGFYLNSNFTYASHSLGFKSKNPETGKENVDPTAYYLITKFQFFHSPIANWRRVFSHGFDVSLKMGDLGSAQYMSNTGDQRSFMKATLQGPVLLSYNLEYDHFFNNSKFGLAAFGSVCNVSGNKVNDNMNGTAAGIGGGLRYMAKPKAGIVLRADYGAGFTFKDGAKTQGQFNMGIGKFF